MTNIIHLPERPHVSTDADGDVRVHHPGGLVAVHSSSPIRAALKVMAEGAENADVAKVMLAELDRIKSDD